MELKTAEPAHSHTILVIDDDSITRRLVRRTLEKHGYRIVEAESGEAALAWIDNEMPALILLDVMMPGMDGFETCSALRRRITDPSLPIIMLTGLNDTDAIDRAFAEGATDFISKPLNWVLLTQRIRYGLRDYVMRRELKEKTRRLEQAQRLARLGYWTMDLSTRRVTLSPEVCQILGISERGQASLREVLSYIALDERHNLLQTALQAVRERGRYALIHRVLTQQGAERVVSHQGEVGISSDGRGWLITGTLQDITERVHAEQLVRYHTYFDALCDMPNRRMFDEQLQQQIRRAERGEQLLAVFFVGIDRFKLINDSLGHHVGDQLLRAVADRLRPLQARGYLMSRFGGDLFAVLAEGFSTVETIDEIASELLALNAVSYMIGGRELHMSASIGIAVYPFEADTAERLLSGADAAMNRAKEMGGNQFRYFSSDMDRQAQERLELERDLHDALKNKEFVVYYQPQIDTSTCSVVGMEALIRWQHPTRGLVFPDKFIGLAEETGLIIPIGEWVLREACQQNQRWSQAGLGLLRVGVNLSAKQFSAPGLVAMVQQVLEQTGLPPSQLDIEVTESIAMGDYTCAIEVLQALQDLGVKTSMDDFGTGYSSLSYLQRLPLNTLKIDRAFIKDIVGEGENGEIAGAIVALAKCLGMHLIAEGVETRAQCQFISRLGCDEIQGYYFSKPVPVAEFERFVQAHDASASCPWVEKSVEK